MTDLKLMQTIVEGRGFAPPSDDDTRRALDSLTHRKAVTLTQLAFDAGISRQAARNRLRAAGIRPTGLGGKTGREELYEPCALAAIRG